MYDQHTEAAIAIRHQLPPSEQPNMDEAIQARAEAFRAGLCWTPAYIAAALRRYDRLLRCRWDFFEGKPAIERWTPERRCWSLVFFWPDGDDGHPIGLQDLIDRLREGDMWRFDGHREYLAHKRAQSARRRRENAKRANEAVCDAVDRLSRKQVQQFLDVETAMRTGETIIAHGDDEKFLDRTLDQTRRFAAQGIEPAAPAAQAMNPHMHPLRYRRLRRMEHS